MFVLRITDYVLKGLLDVASRSSLLFLQVTRGIKKLVQRNLIGFGEFLQNIGMGRVASAAFQL